jgi:hypothetical protein
LSRVLEEIVVPPMIAYKLEGSGLRSVIDGSRTTLGRKRYNRPLLPRQQMRI